ncbi:MAG: T9SS type A sorting domain-containing protein [Flavobacteriales bacterium]|nr:T9SS type A sorting domain-containing protein [Flavobacteriales bacterium]
MADRSIDIQDARTPFLSEDSDIDMESHAFCAPFAAHMTSESIGGVPNDNCVDAIPITSSILGEAGWQSFSNADATDSGVTSCGGAEDDDIWFSFVAQSANDAVIARGVGTNSVVEIFDACGGTPLACEDNTFDGGIERSVAGGLIPGNTYYFRVYHYFPGAGGGTIEVQHKTFEDGGLNPAYCGGTYDLSQSIYAERDDLGQLYSNPHVPVKGYCFRFEEQGGGLTVNYSNPGETPYLTLASVPGLEYGKTYDVSVSHRVRMRANGSIHEFWSGFGASCPIIIQNDVPSTQLQPEFCPTATDLYLEDQIQAVPVAGADEYRFTFDGPGGPFVETSDNYALALHTVDGSGSAGLQYNSSVYNVTVEVQVNGSWSDSGPSCMISMASQPEDTEIQMSYCDGTYDYPDPNHIMAEYVYGATGYEWEWTPASLLGSGVQTTLTNGAALAFHNTDLDLSEGGSWNVRVRAWVGNQPGSFSTICVININPTGPSAPPSDDVSELKLIGTESVTMDLFPNPSDGQQVMLELSGLPDAQQGIRIDILDQTGRTVHHQTIASKGAELRSLIGFEQTLPAGIYYVRCQIDGMPIIRKLTIH